MLFRSPLRGSFGMTAVCYWAKERKLVNGANLVVVTGGTAKGEHLKQKKSGPRRRRRGGPYLWLGAGSRYSLIGVPRPSVSLDPGLRLSGYSLAEYRALQSYLVDPASSHMLVSKIKPCMSKYIPK